MATTRKRPTKSDAKSITLSFNFERETKRTKRFQEENDENPIVGTIYVSKSKLAELGDPENLLVTIEAADE